MGKKSNKFEMRDRLEAFANHMQEQFPEELAQDTVVPQGVWISLKDAMWLETAIRKALADNMKLEQALGLTGSAGAPRSRNAALIAEVFADMPDATQETIAQRVREKYPKTFTEEIDTKTIRRALYKPGGELTTEAVEALARVLTLRVGIKRT